MEPLVIEYGSPTSRALERMKTILFRPFDIGKWFYLGFTAWIASLMDGNSNGGNGGGGGDSSSGGGQDGFEETFGPAIEWIQENLVLMIVISSVVFVIVAAIVLALLWVSSRGKFMFLDNVVHNRALIRIPWRGFRVLGNSLFWWRLGFSLVGILAVLAVVGGGAAVLYSTFEEGAVQPAWIAGLVAGVLALILVIVAIVYIQILLEDFVIPIMYKHSLPATQAWRRFLTVHRNYPGRFVLYFLWKFLLGIGAMFLVIAAIIATCCIALIILILPYLGAVLTLPISVFFRSLGPEFLRQFGDDLDLWEGLDAPPPAPGRVSA